MVGKRDSENDEGENDGWNWGTRSFARGKDFRVDESRNIRENP